MYQGVMIGRMTDPHGTNAKLARAADAFWTSPQPVTIDDMLKKIRAAHGGRFTTIEQDPGTCVWVAIEHPSEASVHYVMAFTLAQLEAKLNGLEA
jgi:hypothetical protein